jgi:hypothetical protein
VSNADAGVRSGAILGLGLAYAGTQREEVQELLVPVVRVPPAWQHQFCLHDQAPILFLYLFLVSVPALDQICLRKALMGTSLTAQSA